MLSAIFFTLQPGLEDRMMADQLFKSIQMAMVNLTKDSAFALANIVLGNEMQIHSLSSSSSL